MGERRQTSYVFQGFDRVSAVAAKVGRSMAGVGRIARQVSAVGKAGAAAARGVLALGAPLAGIAGLGGGFAIKSAIDSFVKLGDQAAKTARQLNMTTAAYTELNYWAERNGLAAEQWATAQRALASRLARAASGDNKKFADLLGDLNIGLRDAAGATRSMDAVMADLAEAFERNEDASTRMFIATQAFGEEMGVRMVDALAQGRASMEDLRAEARRLGISLSDEDGKAAEWFADVQTNLAGVVRGTGFAIARTLIPTLGPLIEGMTAWVIANREVVAAKVGEAVTGIATALAAVDWGGVAQSVGRIADALAAAVDWMGGWENAALAGVAVMNGPLIASFLLVGKELVGLGRLLVATPVGATIAGIAYAASLVLRNWEGVAAWFESMWESLTAIFRGGGDAIVGLLTLDFERAADGVVAIVKGLHGWVAGLFEGIGAAWMAVAKDIQAAIGGIAGAVGGVARFFGLDLGVDLGAGGAGDLAAALPAESARRREEDRDERAARSGAVGPAGGSASASEAQESPGLIGRAAAAGALGPAPAAVWQGDVVVNLDIRGGVEVEGTVETPRGTDRILGYGPAGAGF